MESEGGGIVLCYGSFFDSRVGVEMGLEVAESVGDYQASDSVFDSRLRFCKLLLSRQVYVEAIPSKREGASFKEFG